MPEITQTDMLKAARNESYGTFVLENPVSGESRTFELKHLNYDSYIEFLDLTRPLLSAVANGLDIGSKDGEFKLDFNPLQIDYQELIRLCGKELPRMVWLCCKQSDPKITIEDVKRLAHRPQKMLAVVLQQVKHNEMVKEFQDFFPVLAEQLTALLPDAQAVIAPVTLTTAPTE